MKAPRRILPLAAILFALPAAAALAQVNFPVTPATPQSFKFKPVGQSAATGATVASSPVPALKQTTYLTLGQARQWKSAEGKSLIGQLVAWEQTVLLTKVSSASPAPAAQPVAPVVAGKPTIVRDGKIRLLIDRKAHEVPLDRLGSEDQKFVRDFETSLTAKP